MTNGREERDRGRSSRAGCAGQWSSARSARVSAAAMSRCAVLSCATLHCAMLRCGMLEGLPSGRPSLPAPGPRSNTANNNSPVATPSRACLAHTAAGGGPSAGPGGACLGGRRGPAVRDSRGSGGCWGAHPSPPPPRSLCCPGRRTAKGGPRAGLLGGKRRKLACRKLAPCGRRCRRRRHRACYAAIVGRERCAAQAGSAPRCAALVLLPC